MAPAQMAKGRRILIGQVSDGVNFFTTAKNFPGANLPSSVLDSSCPPRRCMPLDTNPRI